jgi:hypothetical protein
LSELLKIELHGRDGSYWCLSGPGMGKEGVILKPKVSQFMDTPVKTLYVPGPFGEEFAGKRVQRREMVFTVQVGGEDIDPETWASIDASWRWAWDYEAESKLVVTTADGVRWIKVRLFEAPQPYGDKDPHLTGDEEVVMTVTATFPYWQEAPDVYEWETDKDIDRTTFPVHNQGDVAVWPRWSVSAPGSWVLPDFSWGSDVYSRADMEAGRTIWLPDLPEKAHAVVDSDPRVQTIICANEFPAQQQWKGNDLLYPILPGKTADVPVRVSGATGGAACRLVVPRWFSRPWSRPVSLL